MVKNEANIGTQATILKTKDMQHYKINATEEEVVSNVNKPFENNDLSNDSCEWTSDACTPMKIILYPQVWTLR